MPLNEESTILIFHDIFNKYGFNVVKTSLVTLIVCYLMTEHVTGASQLRLEALRAVGTDVGVHLTVSLQVSPQTGLGRHTLATLVTPMGLHHSVCAHVFSQSAG